MSDEQQGLLQGNDAPLPDPLTTIIGQFETLICSTENVLHRTALITPGGAVLTYKQLDDQSELVAKALSQEGKQKGVSIADKTVAVYLKRSPELVTAIFGILKAGAVYLPLDSRLPEERISYMLRESEATCVITDTENVALLKEIGSRLQSPPPVFTFDMLVSSPCSGVDALGETRQTNKAGGGSIVCCLFTSGSTGNPKAVQLTNANILHRLQWAWSEFPFHQNEVMCFKTAASFVDSLSEILSPLLQGFPLVIVSENEGSDPINLLAILHNERVTRITVVPTLLRMMLVLLRNKNQFEIETKPTTPPSETAPFCSGLNLWVSSGEILPETLVKEFFHVLPECMLLNFYGSTEVTGDVTFMRLTKHNFTWFEKVPIGKPIQNTKVYVLDDSLRLKKDGDQGNIYVGGPNVSPGYYKNAKESQNCFIRDPLSDEFLYKTGDLGRIEQIHGQRLLVYEGRADLQLQINGHRVELLEIENAMLSISGVKSAACVQHILNEYSNHIHAFYVADEEDNIDEPKYILQKLRSFLPKYMCPTIITPVTKLPILVSGKIDRTHLRKQYCNRKETEDVMHHTSHVSHSSLQRRIVRVWMEILDMNAIQPNDNFFDLGGNSVNVFFAAAKLSELGIPTSVIDILQSPTTEKLGEELEKKMYLNCTEKRNELQESLQENMIGGCKGAKDNSGKYTITSLHHAMKDEVISFFARDMTLHNPASVALEATLEDGINFLESMWNSFVQEGLSFVAQELDEKIVGVSFNYDLHESCPAEQQELDGLPSSFLPLFTLLEEMKSEFRKKMKLEVPGEWLFNDIVAIDIEYVTRSDTIGIVRLLEEENVNIARSKGYKGLVEINNHYVAKHILGFKVEIVRNQKNFEYNGQQPMSAISPPHELVVMYSKLC